jgi:hypothetical protein
MTMTLDAPRTDAATVNAAPITWQAVKAGVWVGRKAGEVMGIVQARWGEGFVATTRLGKTLGVFATVDDAQASFAETA